MEWLTAPFEATFVQRALWGGILVSAICAPAGTWVVLRGMAFLGDAMSHGLLPGVALAALLGGNVMVGAVASAAVMTAGVTALGRAPRLSQDTGIGLLFVGMLSLGVIIVSRSQSFAVDLTSFLFGDVLAVRQQDLLVLAAASLAALAVSVLGHRAFLALAFDERKAHTLGLRPRLAHAVLLGRSVWRSWPRSTSWERCSSSDCSSHRRRPLCPGPAAARGVMALAALLGATATFGGLLLSWHLSTAAGATVAALAVGLFFLSHVLSGLRNRRARHAPPPYSKSTERSLRRSS